MAQINPERQNPEIISRRDFLKTGIAFAGAAILPRILFPLTPRAEADGGVEGMGLSIPGGHFYTETNGGASPDKGFSVTKEMWRTYSQMGREYTWGPPVSQVYTDELDRVTQAFQRGIFQLTIKNSQVVNVEWMNVFDELSKQGKDGWLEVVRQTPKPFGWESDRGKPWDNIVNNHLSLLDQNPAIKAAYLGDPLWLQKYGLPMSFKDYGNQFVIRCQRGVFQQWKENVPWAKAGEVTIALAGSIAVEAGGIIPQSALVLETRTTNTEVQLVKEAVPAAFPKEIGNLERDGVVIHNMGTRIGVIDNREDPQNNWQAIVAVARQYAPGQRFEFFYYDNPEDVPPPQTLNTPYKYDPVAYWNNEFPGVGNGRLINGQASNGVWQTHLSLPFVKPEDQNKLNRGMSLIITRFYNYNDLFAKQPPRFAAIVRQQALDPYNSGKMNFSLKVVYQ